MHVGVHGQVRAMQAESSLDFSYLCHNIRFVGNNVSETVLSSQPSSEGWGVDAQEKPRKEKGKCKYRSVEDRRGMTRMTTMGVDHG